MKLLKKISIRDLNGFKTGDVKALVKDSREEIFVARIIGSARKVTIGTSTFGEYYEFAGDFRGYNIAGVEHAGGKCYLPEPVDALLAGALAGESAIAVDFAYDIFVVEDTKTEVGFQYRVQQLTEAAPSEPLLALTSRLPTLALAAPKADPVPETEAETPAGSKAKK